MITDRFINSGSFFSFVIKTFGSGDNAVVDLATLAEATKDLSTKEHLKHLGQYVRDSYQNKHSVLQALKDALIFDTLVTISRMTYQYAKVQNKIPKKIQPDFVRYSVPNMAADLLANYHGYR